MAARTIAVPITTAADGSATVDRNGIHGRVLAVGVVVGTLAATTDITITDRLTGAAIATFTNVAANELRVPKVVPVTTAGAALAAGSTDNESPMATGSIRAVVAQGGATLSGTLYYVLEG